MKKQVEARTEKLRALLGLPDCFLNFLFGHIFPKNIFNLIQSKNTVKLVLKQFLWRHEKLSVEGEDPGYFKL